MVTSAQRKEYGGDEPLTPEPGSTGFATCPNEE
jgi:hypothetical protein